MWYCNNCRSPNHPQATACSTCGAANPQQAQAGWGQAQAQQPAQPQPQWGQPPAQSPAQPQWGQPQPQAQWGAQPAAMARPAKSNTGLFVGCGAAGCLGFVIIGAIIWGLIASTGSSSSSDDDGGTSRPSGRLADNVPKRVGSWTAEEAKPLKVSGAVDGIIVTYQGGGSTIIWSAVVMPSESDAQEHLVNVTKNVASKVSVTGEVVRIKDPKGEVIGLGSHFQSNPEWLVYRIDKLVGIVSGPPGDVTEFFRQLP